MVEGLFLKRESEPGQWLLGEKPTGESRESCRGGEKNRSSFTGAKRKELGEERNERSGFSDIRGGIFKEFNTRVVRMHYGSGFNESPRTDDEISCIESH